jgi:hypothetical protein
VFSAERAAEIALNETTVANGIGAIAAIAVAGAMKVWVTAQDESQSDSQMAEVRSQLAAVEDRIATEAVSVLAAGLEGELAAIRTAADEHCCGLVATPHAFGRKNFGHRHASRRRSYNQSHAV